MNTQTVTPPQVAKTRKRRAKISHYIVSKQGKPCGLVRILDGQRGGVLLPSDEPEEFLRRPRCNAAIERTNRCKALLGGSLHRDFLVETHADIRELLSAGEFTVTAIRTEKK